MELSDAFLVRTLFLLTPGIVACRITTSLKGKPYERAWEALVDGLMFSALGYLAAALATMRSPTSPLEAFLDADSKLDWAFIAASSVSSAVIAVAFVAVDSRSGFQRLATHCRLTNRVSNEDVWSWFLEGQTEEWHFLRDNARGLLYFGHIHTYSDSEKRREVWMKDVLVYAGTEPATLLYKTADLYWTGNPEDATIETPSSKIPSSKIQ